MPLARSFLYVPANREKFLEKAHKRLAKFIDRSSIVVLASHSIPLLREWCNRGVFLSEGRVIRDGSIDDAIDAYHASSAA